MAIIAYRSGGLQVEKIEHSRVATAGPGGHRAVLRLLAQRELWNSVYCMGGPYGHRVILTCYDRHQSPVKSNEGNKTMSKQSLGHGWFAEVGQEYPVQTWAITIYHDDAADDSDYDSSWWSERAQLRGFVTVEQADEALALFLRREALMHCEVYARGWDEKRKVVELVQVFYSFANRQWSYRLAYEPTGVSGWMGYYCGEYDSPIAAIRAGQEHWEKLRKLGTGGASVNPNFNESEDYYGKDGQG
jgi:hypothetical protein